MTSSSAGAVMTTIELISFISSIASLVLAIVAIWLSWVLFRLSEVSSRETKEAARAIANNVERLDQLFGRLYADTFAMMKDTVSDMRRHIWPEEVAEQNLSSEAEKRADEKIAILRQELLAEVKGIALRQAGSDRHLIDALTTEVSSVVDRAIQQSRGVEGLAREETLRDKIVRRLAALHTVGGNIVANDFILDEQLGAGPKEVISELLRMRDDGLVAFEGNRVRGSSRLRLAES
jgi:hypothetical protein